MEFRKFGERYLLRLEVGEEIIGIIKDFCMKQGIGSGQVSGTVRSLPVLLLNSFM